MLKKTAIIVVLFIFSVFIFIQPKPAWSGFGVSPPRVWNEHLVPGVHFEQDIMLVQGMPDYPTNVTVVIEAPEIEKWISIQQGKEFVIPAGVQQYPMRVIVDVPKDAGYGNYKGDIRITANSQKKAESQTEEGGSGVSVLLGALVNIDLTVSGEEYSNFSLRGALFLDIEEGWPVKLRIKLENLGNIKIRPQKVEIMVFDDYHDKLLEQGEAVYRDWVEPFKIGDIVAELPAKLSVGSYWGEFKIYKDDKLLIHEKGRIKVQPRGYISDYIRFFGITLQTWFIIIGIATFIGLIYKFKLWRIRLTVKRN